MQSKSKKCFGVLDQVFPLGSEGLREVPPQCFECGERKACLQTALTTKDGTDLRMQVIDRCPSKGFMGRLKRWSERKDLHRRRKELEGKKR